MSDSASALKTDNEKIRRYFFAGGGTGGHIYPAIAVAEQIRKLDGGAEMMFFCSERPIDSQILRTCGFDFLPVAAAGFSARPDRLIKFAAGMLKSYYYVKEILAANRKGAMVIGVGGFVSVPVVLAAARLGIPVVMLNVDIVPGKANRFLACYAKQIFVQFEETAEHFGKNTSKVKITGCPLRESFSRADGDRAVKELGLDPGKKILLITGASSGSLNINSAICTLLPRLAEFADTWQIVHLTGRGNYERVLAGYAGSKISFRLADYYERMADLYAAAGLVIGRSGAVSVAEFAAAHVPAICLPYPYHRDRHQYRNAAWLADAGAAVIVDDVPEDNAETAARLWQQLYELMNSESRRRQMSAAGRAIAKPDAALKIAEAITS